MSSSRSLARFAFDEAAPLAARALSRARDAAEGFGARLVGRDVERRIREAAVHLGPVGVDPFGLDPAVVKYALTAAAFLHRVWFRTEVRGIENVPPGRVLLISNHSGQVPIDGVVIAASMFLDASPPRLIRSMVEKWVQTLPFVSTVFTRCGQVVGVPENARRLLARGEALLVFPEGTKGISKPFAERYKLGEFGLGFLRLALETKTPIVPVALVGAEEQYVNLGNAETLARLLKMPVFPMIPQVLVPGMQMPLPTKYHLSFGAPLSFDGDPDDEDAVIAEKVAVVRSTIQSMINRGLKERKSIFF